MNVSIYVYTYIIYTRLYMYIHTCIYAHACYNPYVCTCIHMFVTCVCKYITKNDPHSALKQVRCVCKCMCVFVCVFVCVCVCLCLCVCVCIKSGPQCLHYQRSHEGLTRGPSLPRGTTASLITARSGNGFSLRIGLDGRGEGAGRPMGLWRRC